MQERGSDESEWTTRMSGRAIVPMGDGCGGMGEGRLIRYRDGTSETEEERWTNNPERYVLHG